MDSCRLLWRSHIVSTAPVALLQPSLTSGSNVGVVIIQLRYTSALNSSDVSLHSWPWVLVTQSVQCATIITSCIPYVHQILECYPSGIFLTPLRYGGGNSARGPVWDTTGANSQSTILQTTRILTRTVSTEEHVTGPGGLSFE